MATGSGKQDHRVGQVRKIRRDGWTLRRRDAFLDELRATLNVRRSCRKVGMSETSLYALKRRDPVFRGQFEAMIAEGYEAMELRYLERAVHGVRRPVFQGGRKIGHTVEYPDRVAMTLLRAHRETAERARERERARDDEIELARLRLAETLGEMNRRMGGEG